MWRGGSGDRSRLNLTSEDDDTNGGIVLDRGGLWFLDRLRGKDWMRGVWMEKVVKQGFLG